ncbi:DUF86 domain-containing protein [Rhodoplanes sp. SY1]|uniref:HepT-like ribonuclease domain-containing protein n=1 Tax=Rhodoplanes sp. SY1 TaxID=3166646 RepID=UPI0038B69711
MEEALAGVSFDDYAGSWLLRSAVERGVEVISEASRHIGADAKARHPEVRWKDIAGIGKHSRHEYQTVDSLIIWKAVTHDLPILKHALLAIRASLER